MDGLVPAKIRLIIGFVLTLLLCSALAACGGGGGESSEGAEGRHEEGGGGDGSGDGDGDGGAGDGDGDGEDGDGGGDAPFASDGISRGVFESIPLAADESFAGLLNQMELAVRFDAANEKFVGRLRNEAEAAVCDVRVSIEIDGAQAADQPSAGSPFMLPGLRRFGRTDFEVPAPGVSFSEWTAIVETFGCASAPTGSGGGEGSDGEGGEGEHGEGEGGAEGGGEGSEGGHEGGEGEGEGSGEEGGEGGEDGDESSPDTPLTERLSGTFQNQNFDFAFDAATGAFRGTVENPTSSTICRSRTEIHLGVGAQVIELGPTIPVDLAPGDIIKIVMSAEGYALDTYSLHPESNPCQ